MIEIQEMPSKPMPAKHRAKASADPDVERDLREDAADHKALAEARKDRRPATPWSLVKQRHGLT